MDRLKENAFAIALGGVCIVLLVLAWFLVWSPIQSLATQERELDTTLSGLRRIERLEETPSAELVQYYENRKAEEETDLTQSIEFYDERLGNFQLYFGNDPVVPNVSAFYSAYEDGIKNFVGKYREAFGIEVPPEEAETNIPPKVNERIKADPGNQELSRQNIPLAMQEYWMIEAIFDACLQLELGGLEEIVLPTGVSRRESRSRSRRDEEPSHFLIDTVDATVTIRMPFSKIEDLLAELFKSQRVPFVGVPSLTYAKDETILNRFQSVVMVSDEGRDESKSYDEVAEEPSVEVKMTLRALSWKGPRPPSETPEEEER